MINHNGSLYFSNKFPNRLEWVRSRIDMIKTGNILVVKTSTWENQTQWANKLSMEKKAELPIQLVTGRMMMMTIMTMMIDREWKESLINTDKNQKKKILQNTCWWLDSIYSQLFVSWGVPCFSPPIHVVVGTILRKRTKKEKRRGHVLHGAVVYALH